MVVDFNLLLINLLIQQEADISIQGARTDGHRDVPVRFGPVTYPADVTLLSPRRPGFNYTIEVTDIVKQFDKLTLVFCFVVFHNVAATLTLMSLKRIKMRRKHCRLYVKWLMHICHVLLDQENVQKVTRWPLKILWTFFCVCYYITVFGYLFNLITTDMVALRKAPEVHSLDDLLYDERFKNHQPVIVQELYLYSLAKFSSPSSKLGQFYRRLNGPIGIVNFNFEIMPILGKRIEASHHGVDELLAINDFIHKHLLQNLICNVVPGEMDKSYTSKHLFAPGIIASIFNKHIDTQLLRYATYKLRTINEFNLIGLTLEKMARAMVDDRFKVNELNAMRCNSEMKAGYNRHDVEARLANFNTSIIVFMFGIALATLETLLECLLNPFVTGFL